MELRREAMAVVDVSFHPYWSNDKHISGDDYQLESIDLKRVRSPK